MLKNLVRCTVFLAAICFGVVGNAGLIVDTVSVDEKVSSGFFGNSASWTHDLTDDGFVPGSAISGTLEVELYDDGDRWRERGNVIIGLFDLFGFLGSDDIYNINPISGVTASIDGFSLDIINTIGSLSVLVTSSKGDFWVGDSTLSINTASVPEPGSLALLSIGILGLGLARRKVK